MPFGTRPPSRRGSHARASARPARPRGTEALRRAGAWTTLSQSTATTQRLGRAIGRCLRGGEVLALFGDLGSGKTTLIRGIACGLGAPARAVSSPTFVLIHEYSGRLRMAHVDLYRIETPADLEHVGLADYLDGETVLAVEWAEKGMPELPEDRLDIQLLHDRRQGRRLRLLAGGPRAAGLLSRIRQDLNASRARTVRSRHR